MSAFAILVVCRPRHECGSGDAVRALTAAHPDATVFQRLVPTDNLWNDWREAALAIQAVWADDPVIVLTDDTGGPLARLEAGIAVAEDGNVAMLSGGPWPVLRLSVLLGLLPATPDPAGAWVGTPHAALALRAVAAGRIVVADPGALQAMQLSLSLG